MPISTEIDLSDRLDELPELLPFPAVALKLLDACKDPETGARDLCQIIECDASLSLKLLQISNSALYGCAGQIRTIEHAAVVLGVRGLRDLALSAAAADVFCTDKQHPMANQLWTHSLGCATVARILAEHVPGVATDEAFVAGLVHDVGKLILLEVLNDQYDLIPKALSGVSTVEQEQRDFGLCHAELGGRCGEDWGLPGEISDAICNHHCPTEAVFSEDLAALVGAANQLSKMWNIGSEGQVDLRVGDVLDQHNLSIDEATIMAVCERAPTAYAESKTAFGA